MTTHEDLSLEQEATADVDDHLRGALQVHIEQRQAIVAGEPLEAFFHDQRFAEDAGRLGERHRQHALHRRAMRELRVVIRVPQLVRCSLRRVEAAAPVQKHQRTIAGERHTERAALLARARPSVDPLLVERTVDQPIQPAAVRRECVAHDLYAFVPRDRRCCQRKRRDEVVPRQRTVVAQQPRLRSHPAAHVGERLGDRLLHCVERGAADAVREQRCVEWRFPTATTVDNVRFALHSVHRRGAHRRNGRPGRQFGVVRRFADGRVGVRGQSANGRHRHRFGAAVWHCHWHRKLRGHDAVQLIPRRRPCADEFAVQALFAFTHLVRGAARQLFDRAVMFRNLFADSRELVDAERTDPCRQPSGQRPLAHIDHVELAEQTFGLFVVAVGGRGRQDVGGGEIGVIAQLVDGDDHCVGSSAVGGGHWPRLGGADAVLFEEGFQARHVGAAAIHGIAERTRLERLVNVGDAPARQ